MYDSTNHFVISGNDGFSPQEHLLASLYTVSTAQKRDYSAIINLSSSELHHPKVEQIFKNFLESWSSKGVYCYPYYPAVLEKVARFYTVDPRSLLLTPGSDDAIRMLMLTVCISGKILILQSPNYGNYHIYSRIAGVTVKEVSYVGKSKQEQVHEFQTAVKNYPGATAIITNPNWASGEYLDLDQVAVIAGICKECNVLLVIDEAHSAFAGLDHTKLLNEYENLLVIRSYSKSFGLAGLRIGAVFGSPYLIELLGRWRPMNSVCILSLDFLVDCLDRFPQWMAIHADIRRWRNHFVESLRSSCPGWIVHDSSTNFVLVDMQSKGSAHKAAIALEFKGIIVKELSNIIGFEECLRITVAPPIVMEQVISILQDLYSLLTYRSLD